MVLSAILSIFATGMKSVIKYIFLAIVLSVISGISMQEDLFMQDDNFMQEDYPAHTKECSQYQHTRFEPQKDICIALHQISSAQCPSRLIKKNKRSSSFGKCQWATLKSGKHNTSYLSPNLSYNNSVTIAKPAEPANQFIRFCRLII